MHDILKEQNWKNRPVDITRRQYLDGSRKGMREFAVSSPCGLDLAVLPDRGMDISFFSFRSVPLSWLSPADGGLNDYYHDSSKNFFRTFFGGLLTSCGLLNLGASYISTSGEEIGTHGKISSIACGSIIVKNGIRNGSVFTRISGKNREIKIYGLKLTRRRDITIFRDAPHVVIEDRIKNIGSTASPVVVLYHINIGFPVVDEGANLITAHSHVEPRDMEAEKALDRFDCFSSPVRGCREKVFYHDIKPDIEGNCNIGIVNKGFNSGAGIGIWLKFDKANLPYLTQWKQMGFGEFACGLEPCNTLIRGRELENNSRLEKLEPGAWKIYRVELKVLGSVEDIDAFINYVDY